MQNQVAYPIESVGNALRLILLLQSSGGLGVTEAARHLDVAPSTAHRLFAMLKHHGFVVQDGKRRYQPGPPIARPRTAAPPRLALQAIMRPRLEALAEELQETVHLAVLRGTTVQFIDGVELRHALRVGSRAGMMLPAHATSAGKALLSRLTAGELRSLYAGGLPEFYGPALTDLSVLIRHLSVTRRRGYAVNIEESERGVTGVAVCLADASGRVHGSLAGAVPTARCPNRRIPEIARALQQAAAAAAPELGGAPS